MKEKSNNVDELNRLSQEGRIAEKESDREQRSGVQAVSEGKKTVDDVEQIVDAATLEFFAHENNLFKNMQEPCRFEGINILADIKEYFFTYKVKPNELEKEIQDYMNQKRIGINQEHKTLFFGENGVLDINMTVEKALRNNEKIPTYVKTAVMDGEIKLPENNEVTLYSKFLIKINEQPDWYFDFLNKNIETRLNNINNMFGELSWAKRGDNKTVITLEGREVSYNENMSEEFSQIYVKIQLMCGELGQIFARGRSDNENQELLAKMVAYYKEISDISSLNFSQMGLSENDVKVFRNIIEETKNTILFKFNMCSLGLNLDELSEEEVKNLVGEKNYDEIDKERKKLDESASGAVHKEIKKDTLSFEDGFITSSEEEKKTNIIRQYRILMSLANSDGMRYTENEDEEIRLSMEMIKGEYPELVKVAEDFYDSANTVEFYSKAIVNNKLLKDLKNIREKGISSSNNYNNKRNFQSEYKQIIPAIIALNMDVKGVHPEDKAVRDEALMTLIGVFPNVVSDTDEIDYDNENQIKEIKNRLFNEIKNRYGPYFNENAFDEIKNYDDLAKKLEARNIYKLKKSLIKSINGNEIEYDEITGIIEDPDTKKYVREEIEAENNEIFENKLYINLLNDVVHYTKLKSKGELTSKLEDEFTVKLATAIQLIEVEKEDRYKGSELQKSIILNRNKSLLDEVKSNLADLHPDVFNKNGTVNIKRLNDVVVKIAKAKGENGIFEGFDAYEKKITDEIFSNGIEFDDESPTIGLTYIAERTKTELENEISSENRSLSTKKKTQEEIKKSLKELVDTSKIEDAERVLQIVHYLKEERQEKKGQRFFERYKYKGTADLNTSRLKSAVSNVEETYKDKVKSLYNDDEKAEESFFKIENHIFDDTVFPGIIREGKRKVANRMLATILKKYDGNEDELTLEDKANVLMLFVGTEYDLENEVIESSINSAKNLQGRLKKYLARINPDLIKDGEVDKELLIAEFNDSVNTNFVDIKDAVIHAEDKLLEEFVESLLDKNKDKEILSVINDSELRANLKIVDAQERRENFRLIQHSLKSLNNSLLTRYDLDVTKKEEVELIEGLYLVVDLYDEQKLDRKGLSERNSSVQDLEKELLEVAKENLKLYFNNTIDKDGKVDKQKLKHNVVEYLIENDPEIGKELQDGGDITEVLKGYLCVRDEQIIGPVVNNSLEHEIEKTQEAVDEYKKNKELFKYLAMINVIGKMRERFYGEGNGRVDRIAKFFDRKCPGLKEKYDSSDYNMEIDDKYVDSVAIICGKSKLQEINDKYFPRGIKGKRFTSIDEIPSDEQKRILQIAIGTIEACKEMGEYKSVTKNSDTIALASNIIKHFVPTAVKNGRIVDEDKVVDCYNNVVSNGVKKSGNYTIDELKRASYKKLYLTVVGEFYDNSVDKTKYFDVFDNSKLRSAIKAKRREDIITNQEMDHVFQSKSETIHVDDVKDKDSKADVAKDGNDRKITVEQPVIADTEVLEILNKSAEELHHNDGNNKEVEKGVPTQTRTEEKVIEQTSTPKVEQQSESLNKTIEGVTVEKINVGSVEPEMSMVTTESRGFISDVISKIKSITNLVKNGINSIKERFGIGQNSSTNNTETSSNSTSSTGGAIKTEQDVVQNLTGYGQQNLDLNAAKAATQNETGKKVSEKGNELEGNEDNERD